MKNLLLRYGVFAILVLMLVGILFILNRFDMRTKQAVNLVVGEGPCRVYTTPTAAFRPQPGDTLRVGQTAHGDLPPLVVDSVRREPSSLVLYVYCPEGFARLQSTLGGDTYATGYIFVGREKLRDKVLRRAGQ